MTAKERFIDIYKTYIKREGADKLLEYLLSSDFFTAPASARFHCSFEGGLCEHSLNVYDCLVSYLNMPRTKDIMGVSYTALKINDVKSYWGCCTRKDEIRYVFRIIYAPPHVMEYLAIHELAHIRHKNHSRWFWAEVEKYCPDWYERRQWLNTRRIIFHIF